MLAAHCSRPGKSAWAARLPALAALSVRSEGPRAHGGNAYTIERDHSADPGAVQQCWNLSSREGTGSTCRHDQFDGVCRPTRGHRHSLRKWRHRSRDPSRTLHDRSPTSALWVRLAILLSIPRLPLVSQGDDPWMVVWYPRMVISNCVEPRYHLHTVASRLA